MIYTPDAPAPDTELQYIKSNLQIINQRTYIENIPGVAGTGITHTKVKNMPTIGSGYNIVVLLETDSQNIINTIQDKIPKYIDYLPVIFKVTDKWEALNVCTSKKSGGKFTDRYRPIRGGASICNENAYDTEQDLCPTGTLSGFPVINDQYAVQSAVNQGKRVILSNNHILAHNFVGGYYFYTGKKGDPIIQPGYRDEGIATTDRIGILEKWITLDASVSTNTVDCAYASINPDIQYDDMTLCDYNITPPSVQPELGTQVKKTGRTTACTYGEIDVLDVSGSVSYFGGIKIKFKDQVSVSLDLGAGDSGSLIITKDDNHPVALLFSTYPQNKITNVEQKLGVLFEDKCPLSIQFGLN